MNDRFKFRAWDGKDMYYDIEKQYDSMPHLLDCEDSAFASFLGNKRFTVMQCTGLKDKNGKLIYEGDVLQHTNSKNIWPVGWVNAMGCCGYNVAGWNIDDTEDLARVEIIGNIYENPEIMDGGMNGFTDTDINLTT